MTAVLKLVVFLFIFLWIPESGAQCLNGWTTYYTSCYKVIEKKVTWVEANDFCRLFGSILVEPKTRGEIDFVRREFTSRHLNIGAWIGLSDIMEEGAWKWTHEQANATEFDWAPNEPNNMHDGDCVRISTDFEWHDDNCNQLRYFMCQTAHTDMGTIIG